MVVVVTDFFFFKWVAPFFFRSWLLTSFGLFFYSHSQVPFVFLVYSLFECIFIPFLCVLSV